MSALTRWEARGSRSIARSAVRRVAVRVEGDEEHVRVVVEDSGPGVPPADAERVLERGWSTKAAGGRGIGLALVGQVARLHHGTVEVAGSDLGGARFTVVLEARS